MTTKALRVTEFKPWTAGRKLMRVAFNRDMSLEEMRQVERRLNEVLKELFPGDESEDDGK